MKQQILLAGGAGYIGSHAAMALEKAGYDVVVFDNLSTGHAEFLRFGRHVIGDLNDAKALDEVFRNNSIVAVMNFAGFINVGESVVDPEKYYINNVTATLILMQTMRRHGVRHMVFSSTCATYGNPQWLPLTEEHRQVPVNPYGRTKLCVEWILEDYARAYGMTNAVLRYFNAAGAAPEYGIGEWHEPETHLIPLILQAALDADRAIKVYGTDYDSPDGTCIRDYIHVLDLADAHILALKSLLAGGDSMAYNLGNGHGYSVWDVIDCARKVTGRPIRVQEGLRRPGDPPVLVGDSAHAMADLLWKPRYADLETIVGTAWEWEQYRRTHR